MIGNNPIVISSEGDLIYLIVFLPFFGKGGFPVCPISEGVYSKRKEFAPKDRIHPIQKRGKNNTELSPPKSVSIPLKSLHSFFL